jgi:hypothetical protein
MSLSQEPGLFVNSSAGVDSSNFVGSITEALSVVKPLLQQAAGNDQLFAAVFGEKANTIEFQTIRGQWKIGDFSQLPSVQVISAADMNGADGAYASSTQTIYLSDGLFSSGAESVGSMLGAAGVLVEESFHWLDAHVGADSKGDEGELARNLVFGVQLSAFELTRIRSEDDRGFITVNGQQEQVAVEMDLVSSLANTLQTAKNIGVLGSTSQIFTGFVGDSVRDNYIRFQVTTPSIFAVELSGLTKDANVRLLNDQGGFIQASYNKGTAIDAFQYQLGVGAYYVHVYREATGDNTNYSLKISAPPVSAFSTLQTAKNIGVLGSTSQTFTGFVGDSVRDNYIRFQVTTPSIFAVELSGLTKDANVRLLNDQGGFIQASYNKGTAIDAFQYQLGVGTYYVHVYREALGDNTNYSLKMSAPPVSTVVPNPFIKVTSPNGFNSIARGSVINITWQDNIAENVRIDLYKAGVFYQNITSSTPSNGSFTWSVPSDVVANTNSSTPNWVSLGNNYDIRVRSVMNSAIFDRSDVNFSITGKTSNDLLGTTLVVAQGVAKAGDTVNISYAVRNDGSDATTGFKVGFYLSNDPQNSGGDLFLGEANVSGLGAKSTSALLTKSLVLPNQGNAFWKGDKGYFIKAIADYKNVIIETNEANNYGQILGNDYGAISVTGTVPPPKITVTSPNGGYSIVRGSLLNISWQDNFAEDVRIDLYKGGQFYRNITQSTPSNGRFIWSVPTDIVANTNSSTPNWVSIGSDYQVRVQSVTNPGVFDDSDTNFAIVGKKSNDLFGTTLALTQNTVKAGDTVNVSYAVRNDGTDATAAFKVGFYLSNDSQSKVGDLFLGEADVSGLAAKSTSATLKTNLVLPGQGNAFWKGDKGYFIKAVADYKNVISETNEANNYGQVLGNDYSTISVTVTDPVIDNAGDTRATAKNLGTLTTSSVTFSDRIGKSDKEDFIAFYVAEPLKAKIEIKPNSAVSNGMLGVKIFDPSSVSSPYNSSSLYSTNTFSQEYVFNQVGWYYLQLSDVNNSLDVGYTLSVNTNSFVSDLGTLNGNRSVAGNSNKSLYRFKVDQNSVVTASSNFPNSISLRFLDSNLEGNIDRTVGLWVEKGVTLNAGTYYLAVSNIPGSDVPPSFTLNLQATPTSRYDNAGLSYWTARDLGTITDSKSITDFIDSTDRLDYYSFTVGSKSSVSLNTTAIAGFPTIGVSLVNDKFAFIKYAGNYYNQAPQAITEVLEAGKYYVQINNTQSDTDVQYRLNVNVQSLVAGDAIGNSYDQVKDLGYLAPNTPVTLKDAIGGTDPADWMKFNISTLGNVSTAFSGLTTPIMLQLSRIEANGSLTAISTQNSGGQANWTPVFSNLVGNYALVVSSGNATSTPYTLNLSTISTNIAPTNVKWDFSGTYGSNQDVIVHGTAFDANGASDLDEARFQVRSKDGSFDKILATKSFTQSPTDSRVANFSINLGKLPIGQYIYNSDVYDKSRAPANTGTTIYLGDGYAAQVVYAPLDTAGDTQATARDLGTITQATSVSEYVGTTDRTDVYRFVVPTTSYYTARTTLTFQLDGLSGDADFSVYKALASGAKVGFNQPTYGTGTKTFTDEFEAGTYFVEVYNRDGTINTNYNLSIAPPSIGTLQFGQSVSGNLSNTDPKDLIRSAFYDDYSLSGFTSGQQVRLTLTASDFVPKIYLIDASTGQIQQQSTVIQNGNQTILDFVVPAVGNSQVRVASDNANQTGSYTLASGSVPIPTPNPPKNPVIESVDVKSAWGANIFQWDRNAGSAPPVNFYDGDSNNPNWLGTLNLGPNNENGNLSGSMKFDWGNSSAAFNSQLPADGFAIRAYTWADFDGSSYNFTVRGDDGYQILAKNQATGEWFYITPKDQWQTQGYGVESQFSFKLPAGRYDLHFHYFENGGEAKMDLSWNNSFISDIGGSPSSEIKGSLTSIRSGIASVTIGDPKNYVGPVWTVIKPETGNEGKKHLVTITWGAWQWKGEIEIPKDGLAIKYEDKTLNEADYATRTVTVRAIPNSAQDPSAAQKVTQKTQIIQGVGSAPALGTPPLDIYNSTDWKGLSFYPNIESSINNYLDTTEETYQETNWLKRLIDEKWDRIIGESGQFGNYAASESPQKNAWNEDLSNDLISIYRSLAETLFGDELGQNRNDRIVGQVTSGYAYDKGYYNYVFNKKTGLHETHAGLDIQAEGNEAPVHNGTPVRAATNGLVSLVTSMGSLGYWVAVDETGKNGEFTGRRWWYGHLYSGINLKKGDSVSVGQTVIGNAGYFESHLHLMVANTWAEKASTAETSNGKGGVDPTDQELYKAALEDVLSDTMSPLEAYWKSMNDRSEF